MIARIVVASQAISLVDTTKRVFNSGSPMDADSKQMLRNVVMVFAVVLAGYIALFYGDNYLRTRKGAWEVEFFLTNDAPAIRVNQKKLEIRDVVVVFQGEKATNQLPRRVLFARPKQDIPFGKTKFEDLTYLPGSVAFDFFGHEIELLPRVLQLNKEEFAWSPGAAYELKPEQKLAPENFYDPREKKRRLGK